MPTEGSTQNSKTCACKLSNSAFECQAIPSKNTQCGLRFGSRFLTPKWGQSPRLIYFCNNNGADSHFGSRFPAPKMGANFESFFSYFNIDVETKTSGPTLKIKPSHSSFQSFRTCNQTFFHKSPIFSPKRQTVQERRSRMLFMCPELH